MTLSNTTRSIMTLSLMTLSTMTLSRMTFITIINTMRCSALGHSFWKRGCDTQQHDAQHNDTQQNDIHYYNKYNATLSIITVLLKKVPWHSTTPTHNIMTFSIKTLSTMTNDIQHNDVQHNNN